MLNKLQNRILNYYKNNSEISGYEGLIKKLISLINSNKFDEKNILIICQEYKINDLCSLDKLCLNRLTTDLLISNKFN